MGTRSFYVYILASRIGGTLYIGVTNDLIRRVAEHRLKSVKGFTKNYDVDKLVYFEQFDDAENAIKREKLLKKWMFLTLLVRRLKADYIFHLTIIFL